MDQKQGLRSIRFPEPPVIRAWASAVGKKEGEGPLGAWFDVVCRDSFFGERTWEQGEAAIQETVLRRALKKAGLREKDLDLVFSGDLLNQCVASSQCLKNRGIPYLGLYGACSTMAEALILSAMALGGGFSHRAAALTSSHFCGAERQYRMPLGYGGQRTPTAQWTVTGAGACLLERSGEGPRITGATLGSILDLGVKDPSQMGAAMAPAALDTLKAHFQDFSSKPEDYDLIVTGDLGSVGLELLRALGEKEGLLLGDRLTDCGCLIFDRERQNLGAGGSGAGCSAAVLCSWLLKKLQAGDYQKILFCGTGALLSPLTTAQKLSIPGICHAVVLESAEKLRG